MTSESEKNSSNPKNVGDVPYCDRGKWTPTNIIALIFAFILAWPIGLFILFWILTGRHVGELFSMVKSFLVKNFGTADEFQCTEGASFSDNVIFNEYQQTQYDRVKEIKEEIKERKHRFRNFRSEAKRRADQEEFDNFMSNGPIVDPQ